MQAAGPDPWPGGCECGGGDTMNALPANDIEAAEPPGPARRRRAGPLRPGHGPSLAAPYRAGRHDANPWCHAGPAGPPGQQWQAGGGMSRGAAVAPEVTAGTGLARARQRFLAAQPVEPGQVRDTILASWQRSRQWNIAAGHIDPCYVRDPDLDTPLARSALPVLQSLLDEGLEGQPVSVIL